MNTRLEDFIRKRKLLKEKMKLNQSRNKKYKLHTRDMLQ